MPYYSKAINFGFASYADYNAFAFDAYSAAGEYVCGTESTSGIGAPGGAAVCASADDVYTYISGAASTDASGSKQSLPLGFNLAQMRLLLFPTGSRSTTPAAFFATLGDYSATEGSH